MSKRTDGFGAEEPGLALRFRDRSSRLSSQHEQLDVFFGMVISALERHSLEGARVAFIRFRDALDAHITLEDRVFFPALRGLQPALTEELTALVEDHHEIRVRLDELQDMLAKGSAETFQQEFGRLGDDIAEHEQREEDLLARTTAVGH